jgi:recombination protein RecA
VSPKTKARLAAQIAADIRKAHLITDPETGKKIPDPLVATTLEGGGRARVKEFCPTGCAVLDHHVLGCGGLPWGRIYEVAGAEGAGKTTWVAGVMARAQQDGAQVILSDMENKFHTGWASTLGLALEDAIEYAPRTIEEYAQEILRLISKYGSGKRRTKLMFVLDSVPPLLPERAFKDGELRDTEIPGVQAAAWSRWLAVLTRPLQDADAMLVLINQLRSKVGVMFGPTEDTPAGRAIKHYASCRFSVTHGKAVESGTGDGKSKIGRYMKVGAPMKNNFTGRTDMVELKLLRETGFDDRWSVCEFAKKTGCLAKSAEANEERWAEAMGNLGWPMPPAAVAKEDDADGS